VQKQKSTMLI